MKRLTIAMMLTTSLLFTISGCSKDPKETTAATTQAQQTVESSQTQSQTETVDMTKPREAYDALQYITLGQYKEVEVSKKEIDITDEVLEQQIQTVLNSQSTLEEVTDRPVQDGDIVNIDYEGKKDGIAFEGGTAKGQDLTIGSGRFIEGFEEGLIGAKIGETVELNLKFPEGYRQKDLAGQDVVFSVKINGIKYNKVPELTDAYVQEISEYNTVAEYREELRKLMRDMNKQQAAFEKVIENSQVKEYPESVLSYYRQYTIDYYTGMAAQQGLDLETFVMINGDTMETFEEKIQPQIQELAKREMAIYAIRDTEGLVVSDEYYNEKVEKYAADQQVTADEFVTLYGQEKLKEDLTWNVVNEFLAENAVEVE